MQAQILSHFEHVANIDEKPKICEFMFLVRFLKVYFTVTTFACTTVV